jgi:polyisoprenoid-binding protein YceI
MSGGKPLTIGAGTSRLLIKTFAGGPLAAFGHDLVFAAPIHKGEITFDAEKLTGSVHLRIRADAIALQGDTSEKDRREIERTLKEKVLEVAKYTEIVYESEETTIRKVDGGYDVEVAGSLTLHGVTRRQPVRAKVIPTGSMLRAFGEFSLRLSDFAIEQVTVAGGAMKVKDEIKAKFDIVARS